MRGTVAKELRRIAGKVSEPTTYVRSKKTGSVICTGRRLMYKVLKKAWMAGKREYVQGLLH
ncbi:MAG: hypothetical protein HY954_07565 [Deltaproteobacteria bacterium]|nr:hypothetical protein [Deltaproteobacteria bacterium]